MKTILAALFALALACTAAAGDKAKQRLVDTYVAVFDLEMQGVDSSISRPLTESIRREIVISRKYEVIDRGNMNKILEEQAFQMSGCVSGQCAVEAGQLLGVGKIVTGSVSLVGKTYYLSLALINVQTGKIENVSEEQCLCKIDDLIASSKAVARSLLGGPLPSPAAVTPASKAIVEVRPPVVSKPRSKASPGLGKGLVAYYPFDGNARDESGNGKHGVVHGATLTSDRLGRENSAYSFLGTGDWIEFGNDPVGDDADAALCVWLSQRRAQRYGYVLSSGGQTADSRGYYVTVEQGRVDLGRKTPSRWAATGPQIAINQDEWNHICLSYERASNLLRTYLNGNLHRTYPSSLSSDPNLFRRLTVGKPNNVEAYYFIGAIDDIRIYNRVLSDAEIQEIYLLQ